MSFPIALSCFPGLASVLKTELEGLGLGPVELLGPSIVLPHLAPDIGDAEAIQRLRNVRVARRILRLFHFGSFSTIEDMARQVDEIPFAQRIDPQRSFAVMCWRFGNHPTSSPDIAGEIGAVIRIGFRQAGLPMPRVDLKHPEQRIVVQVLDDEIWIGLDLAGELDRRAPSVDRHDAPLNPSIAAALMHFGEFDPRAPLLDPMAGGGTIIQEAARIAELRGLPLHGIAADNHPKAFGRLEEALMGLRRNHSVDLVFGDAGRLDYIPKGSLGAHVVTNPPYGLRLGNGFKVDMLYQRFAKACREHSLEAVTAITPRKRSWLQSFADSGYELRRAIPVLYDRMTVWLMHHERINAK